MGMYVTYYPNSKEVVWFWSTPIDEKGLSWNGKPQPVNMSDWLVPGTWEDE